ncbi:lipoate-protein ligase-like [Novymonas esmeraldas]|uniref:Lipoate-protein ligase-like n=1 Tax=Novymonas esmeraldas TaxID=1808958 RepID=A0AAW0EV01_9TRYP
MWRRTVLRRAGGRLPPPPPPHLSSTCLVSFLRANGVAAKAPTAALHRAHRHAVAETNSRSIYANLAAEEALLRGLCLDADQCLLLLYVNDPCVVVGRNQNIFQEVALRRAAADGVAVARRASGGGAVYHDTGNLCFSFLTHRSRYAPEKTIQLVRLGLCVSCGIAPSRLTTTGRHDLFLDGRKITGSAMRVQRDIAYHHCTLLVNTPHASLGRYLHPDGEYTAFKTSSVGSVRSPVTTLAEAGCIGEGGGRPATMAALKTEMVDFFLVAGARVLDAAAAQWDAEVTELRTLVAAERGQHGGGGGSSGASPSLLLDVAGAVAADAAFVEGEGRRAPGGDAVTLGEAVRRTSSRDWAYAMPPFTSTVCVHSSDFQCVLQAFPAWGDVVQLSSITAAELMRELQRCVFDQEEEDTDEATAAAAAGAEVGAALYVHTTVESRRITAVAVTRTPTPPPCAPSVWVERYLCALLVGHRCDAAVEGIESGGDAAALAHGLALEAGQRCPDLPDLARDTALLLTARALLCIWRDKNVFDVAP